MASDAVVLPAELTRYLLDHPDLFSDVLAHAVATKQSLPSARTFGMHKTKRGDDDDDDDDDLPSKKAHVDLVDRFHDLLIYDHRDKIYEQLIQLMDTSEDVLVALLHLGAVSTTIRDEVAYRMRAFIKKSDLVNVMCRNVVMYFDQPLVRDLYIDALAQKAPMIYQAWIRILDEPIWRVCLETHLVPVIHKRLDRIPSLIYSGQDPVLILASFLVHDPATEPLNNRHPTSFACTADEIICFAPDTCTRQQFDAFTFDGLQPYIFMLTDTVDPHLVQSEFLTDVCELALRFGRLDAFVAKIAAIEPVAVRAIVAVHLVRTLLEFLNGTPANRVSVIQAYLRTLRLNALMVGCLLHAGASLEMINGADTPPLAYDDLSAIQWGPAIEAIVSFHRVDVLEYLYRGPSSVMHPQLLQTAVARLTHLEYTLARASSGQDQLAMFKALLRLAQKSPPEERQALTATLGNNLLEIRDGAFPTISDELGDYIVTTTNLSAEDRRRAGTARLAWSVAKATVFDPSAWLISIDHFATVVATNVQTTVRANVILEMALATNYADPSFTRQLINHFVAIYRAIQERADLTPLQKDAICDDIFIVRSLHAAAPLQPAIHWSNFWMYIESAVGFSLYERLLAKEGKPATALRTITLRLLPCSADPWRFVLLTLRTPRPARWLLDIFKMYLYRFHQLPSSAQMPAAVKFFVGNLKAYARQSNGLYIEPTRDTSNVAPIEFIFDMVENDMRFVTEI